MNFKFWLIATIAAFIMFINLGSIPLFDPDEPVYAQTAKEMLNSGNFISPRIYGEYWYDKPPMYYWLTAASFSLFGISEFSARFPSAILAVATALAVYNFSGKLFTARAAFLSALILTSSIEFFYLGKAAVTDMTLTFCLTISLLSFITQKYYLFYLFAGLAVLTKGPIGFLFPLAIVVLYLLSSKKFHVFEQMKLVKGLLLFSIIAMPWYVIMYKIHGQVFIDTFLGFHNVTRFTSPEHESGAVWYYFIPVLLIGFFPWTAVLFQSVRDSLDKKNSDKFNTLLFFNIWAAFIFLFFSVSKTKLISYILPMYPAIAIITGWYIDKIWKESTIALRNWSIAIFFFSSILLAGLVYITQKFPELIVGIVLTGGVLTVLAVSCLIFGWKRQTSSIFWSQILAMIIFFVVQMNFTFPAISPTLTIKYAAQEFLKEYDGLSQVYVTKFLRPGFAFYTGIYGQEIPRTPKRISKLNEVIENADKGFFIVRERDYNRLDEDAKRAVIILAKIQDRLVLKEK